MRFLVYLVYALAITLVVILWREDVSRKVKYFIIFCLALAGSVASPELSPEHWLYVRVGLLWGALVFFYLFLGDLKSEIVSAIRREREDRSTGGENER